jgi:diaminobutyrate acetyltransferase
MTIRKPEIKDAMVLRNLEIDSAVLEVDSIHSFINSCKYLCDTSLILEESNRIQGFIFGSININETNTIFIHKIFIEPECRRQGLATYMLINLLSRIQLKKNNSLKTIFFASDIELNAFYESITRKLETKCSKIVLLENVKDSNNQKMNIIQLHIGSFDLLSKKQRDVS